MRCALLIVLVMIGCARGEQLDSTDAAPLDLKQPPPPKDGSSTAPGCDGIPESGRCDGSVATYCEITDGRGSLRHINCGALGKGCVIDVARGAVCEAAPPMGCGSVTYQGSCEGQTAVWCANNTIMKWDCAAAAKHCSIEPVIGAYCVGNDPPPSNECPALGFAGTCGGTNNQTARYCQGDQLVEVQCGVGTYAGKTCQMDACATGAWCCAPAMPVDECSLIGLEGICTAAGKPRWCSNGEIQEVTCATGTTCQIDVCGNGAYCCD